MRFYQRLEKGPVSYRLSGLWYSRKVTFCLNTSLNVELIVVALGVGVGSAVAFVVVGNVVVGIEDESFVVDVSVDVAEPSAMVVSMWVRVMEDEFEVEV